MLRLLAGTALFQGIRERLKAGLRRAGVTLSLLLVAAFFFALAVLYLVHAFYIWLAASMGGAVAALITAGMVGAVGLLVLGIVAAMRSRRPAQQPNPFEQAASQLGQTLGVATATRLLSALGRKIRLSPRLIVLAIGIAATLLALSLVRGRSDEDRNR